PMTEKKVVPAPDKVAPVPVIDPAATKKTDEEPKIRIDAVGAGTGPAISVGGSQRVDPRPAAPSATIPPVKEQPPIVVGGTATASVPPLSVPPVSIPATVRSSQSDVVVYTEEGYFAQRGDTYKAISQAKYGSPNYADALSRFNYTHPLADESLP